MVTIRAFRAFDMRNIIQDGDITGKVPEPIHMDYGGWTTTFTGDFSASPLGITGTLRGVSQIHNGHPVFEAVGLERSASTCFSIVAEHDNDRFLAYTLSGDDLIKGSRHDDYMIGFGGHDRLVGGAGDDKLFGGSDADAIFGGSGNDLLAGGLAADVMRGGSGDDTYLVDRAHDKVIERSQGGHDTMLSSASVRIAAHVEVLILTGDARLNARGDGDADELRGNGAHNRLDGGGGRDVLSGGGGADRLDGGFGADTLTGGRGADTFAFSNARAANGDRILDFDSGRDRINLAALDADTTHSGSQRFHLIGNDAFSGHAGELQIRTGRIAGDLDGDRIADFAIHLDADATLAVADLIL